MTSEKYSGLATQFLLDGIPSHTRHSHSIVPGGFDVTS
jgi:hypothetical protein